MITFAHDMNVLDIPEELILDWEYRGIRILNSTESDLAVESYFRLTAFNMLFWKPVLLETMIHAAHYLITVLLKANNPDMVLSDWRKKRYNGVPSLRALGYFNRIATIMMVSDLLKFIDTDGLDYQVKKKILDLRNTTAIELFAPAYILLYAFEIPVKVCLFFINIYRGKTKSKRKIPVSSFNMRELTDKHLAATDWRGLTNNYRREEIFTLISFLSKDYNHMMKLMDIVILAARRDLFEFDLSEEVFQSLRDMKKRLSIHPSYRDETERQKILQLKESSDFLDDEQTAIENQQPTESELQQEEDYIPHLPQSRDEETIRRLYRFLVNADNQYQYQYIAPDTREDNWLYVMGFTDNTPRKFKPIKWLQNKQIFWVMLKSLMKNRLDANSITRNDLKQIVVSCFIDKKGLPLRLLNNDSRVSSNELDALKEFLSDLMPDTQESL